MSNKPSELIRELEYFRVSLPLEYREEATELFDKIIGVLKKDGGRYPKKQPKNCNKKRKS